MKAWFQLKSRLVIKTSFRYLIGVIFLYAGFIKIQNPVSFAESVSGFGILPALLIGIVVLTLPWLEIIVGGLLLSGYQKSSAFLAVCGMSLIFIGAMGWALAKGLLVDCGCFGSEEISRGKMWMALIRDILLFIGSGWLYREELLQRKEYKRDENGEAIQPQKA